MSYFTFSIYPRNKLRRRATHSTSVLAWVLHCRGIYPPFAPHVPAFRAPCTRLSCPMQHTSHRVSFLRAPRAVVSHPITALREPGVINAAEFRVGPRRRRGLRLRRRRGLRLRRGTGKLVDRKGIRTTCRRHRKHWFVNKIQPMYDYRAQRRGR